MKKWCSLIMVICLLFTGTATVFAEERNFDEHLEIKWFGYNQPNEMPMDDTRVARRFEEMYNIDIKNIQLEEQNPEKVSLFLNTGLEFDINTYCVTTVEDMLKADAIRSIPLEYLETYAPDIVKMLDNAHEKWKSLVTVDGEIWCIPIYSESYKCPSGMALRTDWLKNLNIEEMPTTLDELEEMLLRFRTDDPDGNGVCDTYALTMPTGSKGNFERLCPYVFGAYGVVPHAWNIAEDGAPVYYATMEGYREALKRMRKWYEIGIFDPECVVDTSETAAAKVASGRIAGCTGTEWLLISTYNNTPFNELCLAHPELDPDTVSTIIPPVPKAYSYANTLSAWSGTFFGRNCSDEKMIRLLQLLNDSYRDEDLMALALYGEKDIDYTVDEEGFYNVKYLQAQYDVGNGRYYHFSIPPQFMKMQFPNARYKAFKQMVDWDVVPRHIADLFKTPEDTEYGAAIGTIETEYFWKVLVGEANTEEDWDAYVKAWNDAGGKAVTEAKLALAEEKGLN